MAADRRYRKFVLQQRLTAHVDLVRLSGTAAVQTVRTVTYVDRDGRVEVDHAYLRVITGSGIVDNYRAGKSGNLRAAVRVEDGEILGAWAAAGDGIGLEHPHSAIVRLYSDPVAPT